MKKLTEAEEQIMQVLWELGNAFVRDILPHLPDPKPAYNTVSTIVRILEKKGIVGHRAFGKSHQYHPLVSKREYTRNFMSGIVKNYFGDSYPELVSFFTRDRKLSLSELEEIKALIMEEIQKQKKEPHD